MGKREEVIHFQLCLLYIMRIRTFMTLFLHLEDLTTRNKHVMSMSTIRTGGTTLSRSLAPFFHFLTTSSPERDENIAIWNDPSGREGFLPRFPTFSAMSSSDGEGIRGVITPPRARFYRVLRITESTTRAHCLRYCIMTMLQAYTTSGKPRVLGHMAVGRVKDYVGTG